MNKSEQTNELFSALVKAQMEIRGAAKDSVNPFFKSKYADLQSVWDACREPLTKNGLCVIQSTDTTEQGTAIVTVLGHVSGQWISGTLPISAAKLDPQGVGSAITYSRRYALCAMVGIHQTDDDAESAMPEQRQTATVRNIANAQSQTPKATVSAGRACPICHKNGIEDKYTQGGHYCFDCKKKY